MPTEHPFVLPHGYESPDGNVHREGTLRLATAGDEIAVLGDARVRANRAYGVILLLSRVVTRLGELEGDAVTPEVIEGLYSRDFAHLHSLYRNVNGENEESLVRPGRCPHCGRALGAPGDRPSGEEGVAPEVP